MKKIVYIFALLVVGVSLSACVDLTRVESIELNWTPAVEYVLDDEVLLDDKEVTINFEAGGGNPLIVTIDSNDIEKLSGIREDAGQYYLDTSTLGTFTLKIGYQGSTISIQYRVVEGDPTPSIVTTDGELRALVANATDTFVVTMGANITLTGDLTSSHLFSIDTTVDYELDLGGFDISINVPEGKDDYLDNSFAFTGSFVNGFVNVSSVFENTPDIGYLFTNSAVANQAIFDSVVIPLGTVQADLQTVIDDPTVKVLLLEEGDYNLDTEHIYDESTPSKPKTAALYIDSETIIIGTTNVMGEPTTVLTGNNVISNAIGIGGNFDIEIHNIVFEDYEVEVVNNWDGYPAFTTAKSGVVVYSLGYPHDNPFTGTLVIDNAYFHRFMKNAMAFYGGTIYLLNSVLDGANYSEKDGHVVNGIQASYYAVMYVENNFITNFRSEYIEGYPEEVNGNDTQWSSTTVMTAWGGEMLSLKNNIFSNNSFTFYIYNLSAATSLDPIDSIAGGFVEEDVYGNTLIDNDYNVYIAFGLGAGYYSDYATFDEIVNRNNQYPLLNEYDPVLSTSRIIAYNHYEINATATMTQGTLIVLSNKNLTMSVGSELILDGNAIVILYPGATIDESSLTYFAWYMDGDYKYYVASIDDIEVGTQYTTSEGVTYTK